MNSPHEKRVSDLSSQLNCFANLDRKRCVQIENSLNASLLPSRLLTHMSIRDIYLSFRSSHTSAACGAAHPDWLSDDVANLSICQIIENKMESKKGRIVPLLQGEKADFFDRILGGVKIIEFSRYNIKRLIFKFQALDFYSGSNQKPSMFHVTNHEDVIYSDCIAQFFLLS